MRKKNPYTLATYSAKQRVAINFLLATFFLIVAQFNWPGQLITFVLGLIIYSTTILWVLAKLLLPPIKQAWAKINWPIVRLPQIALPKINLPNISSPSFKIAQKIFIHAARTKNGRRPRLAFWRLAERELEYYLKLDLTLVLASMVLGLFYVLSFIRFLNAHNGLSMFFVWQGF